MKYWFILVGPLVLSGCEVGPNYRGPPPFVSDLAPKEHFVRATDPAIEPGPGLSRWWETLDDRTLDALELDALAHSPSLDIARARIAQAQQKLMQQRADRLPSAGANSTYLKARIPGIDLASDAPAANTSSGQAAATNLSFYDLGLNASWELDLFGGGRRGVERDRATTAARKADLADAQVSLTARVAEAYVNLREVQARINLTEQSLRLQERQFALTQMRLHGGTASQTDLERIQSRVQRTRAANFPLGAMRNDYLDQIAVLTGKAPGALDAMLSPFGALPHPPSVVAVANPASLIGHRPDVRSAEQELAAATAAIGVSRAKQFPTLRFTGILGLGGTEPGDALDFGKLTALLAPSLSWSFLDFGKARAETRQSRALRDQAEAQYRQTVLAALEDAETSLSRFGSTRGQLAELVSVEATAVRTAQRNALRVVAGTGRELDQLDNEDRALDARTAVIQAEAQLTISYIAVQKAVGLGWSDDDPGCCRRPLG